MREGFSRLDHGDRPQVSAVVPTRGRPELLQRALRSVLAQTGAAVEAVVVVDGPDPETVAMLDGMADARVRVFALPASVGGSMARNLGVRMARGAWVGLLDDDDEWLPEKCARQLARAQAHGGPAASALVVSRFIARSAATGDRVQPIRLPGPGEPLSEYMFSPRCGFQTSTFFCRRELLLRVPFTAGLKGCQDLDWFLRVTAEPDVKLLVCDAPLAVFHVPEARASVSRGLDWRFQLEWGRSRRELMTARAYSLFVVQVCATKARELPFRWATFQTLLRECVRGGRADAVIVGHLVALFTLPAAVRQWVRAVGVRAAGLWVKRPSGGGAAASLRAEEDGKEQAAAGTDESERRRARPCSGAWTQI
jgi:glycosyltransferase involved in cell wall biosynthesis